MGAMLPYLRQLEALMIREVHCRFAGGALSYLWTFITPVLWIIALVISFRLLGREPGIHADVASFVATGMLPYVIFRQTITAMSRAMATARSLRHLSVNTSDILTASAALEMLNAIGLFAIIFTIIGLWFGLPLIQNPLGLITSLVLCGLLAAGFGRFCAVLIQLSDAAARIIPIALRPLFWISGIFFVASELASPVLNVLWWNPLLHVTELLRSAVFTGYQSRMADPAFVLACATGFYILSLTLQRAARQNAAGQSLI